MKIDKSFVALLVGRCLQALLALVAIRILTSVLNKENVGMTYLVASITSYFSLIFINPVGMYLNRKLHEWFRENKLFDAFRILNLYFLLVALFSVPIVLLAYFYLNIGTGFIAWQICTLVFFNIYAGTWFQTLCPSLNMLEHRTAFVVINLFAQVAGLLFSILGIFFIERTAFVWLTGILIGQVFGTFLSWLYFVRMNQDSSRLEKTDIGANLFLDRKVFYFCLPVAVTTAFMWGQNQSYRLIVESTMGAEVLAFFGVGLGVAASIAGLAESLMTQYFYPRYYATVSSGNRELRIHAWNTLCLHALSVYIPITLYLFFGAKFILRVLVSSQFSDSVHIVMWGAFIEFFRIMTNVIYVVSQSEMKTRFTIIPYFVGALVVVGGLTLSNYFIKPADLMFVPLAICIAGFLVCLTMYFYMTKVLPIKIDFSFLRACLFFSIPFVLMYLFNDKVESLFGSLLVCGVFGIYLIFAIWKLHQRAEKLS